MSLTASLLLFVTTPAAAADPAAGTAPAEPAKPAEPADAKERMSLVDPDDGWFDVSEFLDKAYGFVPVVMPITEPAVGYGAAGGLLFIDRQEQVGEAGFQRPNLTMVGGLGTENGTWGVMAADLRYWLDDRLQTMGGVIYAPLKLDFFGVGDGVLSDNPLSYTLTPRGGILRGKYRLGEESRWWMGLGYAFSSTEVDFDQPASLPPGVFPRQGTFRTGGLTPSVSFDSRDNFFTPTRGVFAEASCSAFSEVLGSESEFQKAAVVAIGYVPLHPRLTLGVRGDAAASFGDAPFYLRPFVMMRGVAAMRYQGEEIAQVEGELRWQFWQRWSVVGFGGIGAAWNDLDRFHDRQTVTTWGTGLRYELARKYGLHMGVDVAFGPDTTAFYVQLGSAWMRP